MMSAHREGKNQILFFEPSLTERTQKRLTQESEILHGIEQRHFTLSCSRRSTCSPTR